MAHIDKVYNRLAETVLNDGFKYLDSSRADISMLQIPHYTLDIDMNQGFPLLTTKKIYWKTIAHELIWMLSGSTNIDYLVENGVKIWDKDAFNYSGGSDVGRIYGAQWKFWTTYKEYHTYENGHIDQIHSLIKNLKSNFYNRRHIVTAWNPAELKEMALPPCHWSFEVIPTKPNGTQPSFAIKWHQRSVDTFLGLPFDIGSYAILGKLIEKETGYKFSRLIGDLSNVHFYEPHIPLIKEQLSRSHIYSETQLYIAPQASILDCYNLNIDYFKIVDYRSHKPIKAEMFAKVKTEV